MNLSVPKDQGAIFSQLTAGMQGQGGQESTGEGSAKPGVTPQRVMSPAVHGNGPVRIRL
jgi:hypothetical protein